MMLTYQQYIDGVLSGSVVAGKLVILSVQKFQRLRERDDIYFDEEAVLKVVKFVSILKHNTGKHNGKPFILEPWQQFITAYIYGLKWKSDNTRVVKDVYIQLARKNGKTAYAAALSLYHLLADGEANAEVLLTANSKDQAKIALKMAQGFSSGLDPKQKQLKQYRADINIKSGSNENVLKVLAADTSKLDGYNASFWLQDELHEARDGDMTNVLKSSQAMRENPLGIQITTAGFNLLSYCKQVRDTHAAILKGELEDDTQAAFIYELDEGDDLSDENNWLKCSPNLDVTCKRSFMRDELKKANNSATDRPKILTKTFNQWVDSDTVWIPSKYTDRATKQAIDMYGFQQHRHAYIGLDLASTDDLTAVSLMIPDLETGEFYFKTWYFLPEENKSRISQSELTMLKHTKQLTFTPGNVTDYDYIISVIKEIANHFSIISISYDSYNSTQMIIKLTDEGFNCQPYSQSIGNFNKPTKEFERLILSEKTHIDKNYLTSLGFRSVKLRTDHNGNTKPDKGSGHGGKIDGIISMLMALGGYLTTPVSWNGV